MNRAGRLKQRETSDPSRLQPMIVLPLENSDDHPLMQKYAQISKAALKNSSELEAEVADDPPARVG